MPNILIVGASRGLGASLVEHYSSQPNTIIFATSRSAPTTYSNENIKSIGGIDVATENAGAKVGSSIKQTTTSSLNLIIITAGYFATETLDSPNFDNEVAMYKISAIGPVFIVHHLVKAGLVSKGAKVILVSSESGSITLRHESEGGGNYGHHASKSALNMVGKLLSLDLKERGIAVGIVHPGFMRTEMTKGVGFDKFWDHGGAVTPDEAANSLSEWIEGFDLEKTGQYWAPRGSRDIGTAEPVLGKDLPTPLQLPW